jgi:DNA invertase Pin-like site-specific DNA recombinase
MLLYRYARVSTHGQTLGAQIEQLTAAGSRRVYREKASGARADRRQLKRLLRAVAQGDTVVVTRIDRLATFDLFAIIQRIVDSGAHFRSLAEPWADTTTSTGRLMIAVLGGLADVERDLIRTRTTEGRARAKARGVKLGPKFKLSPAERKEALARRAAGESSPAIGRSYKVSHSTILRLRPRTPSSLRAVASSATLAWSPDAASPGQFRRRSARPCAGSCAVGCPEILRHLAEGLQDHGVVEFAKVRIAAAREGDGSRVRLIARHGPRSPDGSGSARAFDRLSGRQPAFDIREG